MKRYCIVFLAVLAVVLGSASTYAKEYKGIAADGLQFKSRSATGYPGERR